MLVANCILRNLNMQIEKPIIWLLYFLIIVHGYWSKVLICRRILDKGYPVILGEFGAIRRSSLTGSALQHHLDARAYYYQYVTQQAKSYGLVPFVWDNGATGDKGMGIFNRSDGSVFDLQTLNAYIAGASAGVYPY